MRNRAVALCLLLGIVLVVAGCSRSGRDRGVVGGPAEGMGGETGAEAGVGLGEGVELPARGVASEGPRVPIPDLLTVYFDYDKSILRSDAMATLDQNAAWLLANPKVVIEIEGHCDNRGSEQYNLALGERRALAMREYLIEKGVTPDRIFTRTYGELRPAVPNATTDAEHQQNRRGEFKEILQQAT